MEEHESFSKFDCFPEKKKRTDNKTQDGFLTYL